MSALTQEPAEAGGSPAAGEAEETGALGVRAARTREAILEASRQLFLDRGYTGTRINNITDACGISRAGFYTYFKDKREVFDHLGRETYQDILKVVGRWDTMPKPCTAEDVHAWVLEYFAFMDKHGAFILSSAHSAPDEEDFREDSRRMQMRVAWLLGFNLRSRQADPTDAPEALGMSIQSMLDRSWYSCKVQQLPISEKDMIRTLTQVIVSVLGTAGSAD
jgi:AcrR family transcriptional regulator